MRLFGRYYLLVVCVCACINVNYGYKQLHKNKLQLHVTLGLVCQLRYEGNNLSSSPGSSKNFESESSQSTGKFTLLDKLKSPTSSDLARKQKLTSNPPPKGMKRSKGMCIMSHGLSLLHKG